MGTITARMFNALGTRDIEEGAVIPVGFDAYNQEVTGELSKTVAARNDMDTASLVAHTLRGAGFDASEDGTGRGTPLVPVAINLRGREGGAMPELSDLASLRAASGGSSRSYVAAIHENQRGEITTNDTVGALNSGGGKPGQGYAAIALQSNANGDDGMGEDIAPTLRTGSGGTSGNGPAVAFTASKQANSVATDLYNGTIDGDVTHSLRASTGNAMGGTPSAMTGMQVRRLTPRECERLQGFPDDYTLVPHRGKPAADGPRYKALGNSMAVPCMAWLGRRIAMVDAI
jgi:DNA (cytosine-5)-methyltransferase 1